VPKDSPSSFGSLLAAMVLLAVGSLLLISALHSLSWCLLLLIFLISTSLIFTAMVSDGGERIHVASKEHGDHRLGCSFGCQPSPSSSRVDQLEAAEHKTSG